MTSLSDFGFCEFPFANFAIAAATVGKTCSELHSGTSVAAKAISGAQLATCSTDAYIFVKFCKALLFTELISR
jgi:hypothetical protein